MSASEFGFLGLGLVLGLACGVALLSLLRARPPSPREVRLTVAPGSVPRRGPATLATLAAVGPETAQGGPADPGLVTVARTGVRVGPAGRRTETAVAVPIQGGQDLELRAMLEGRSGGHAHSDRLPGAGREVPVPVGAVPVPAGAAGLDVSAFARGNGGGAAERGGRRSASAPGTGGGQSDPPLVDPSAVDPAGAGAAPAALDPAGGGPCGEVRRLVADRCGLADRLRALAEAAEATLREGQRNHDACLARVEEAERGLDPRAIREAKEAAQRAFRAARERATGPQDVEAAAKTWLSEINRVNRTARDATATLGRERELAARLGPEVERLSVEADARRISAEAAMEECLAAREALAACEEAERRPAPVPEPVPVAALIPTGGPPVGFPAVLEAGETGRAGPATPAVEPDLLIVRLLRGDRPALLALVGRLGGTDPAEQRHWQLLLSDLVDAILARAIEAGYLEYPAEHPFWGLFTREQAREVGRALASLGYRFDGLGGFADGRTPGQRDLSLAVGYAGQDPMRVRRWPNEAEMADLLAEVSVAADEYLAAEAGGLTLGELVALLGRRADALADLWNNWGRVRPVLLESL